MHILSDHSSVFCYHDPGECVSVDKAAKTSLCLLHVPGRREQQGCFQDTRPTQLLAVTQVLDKLKTVGETTFKCKKPVL